MNENTNKIERKKKKLNQKCNLATFFEHRRMQHRGDLVYSCTVKLCGITKEIYY